MKRLKKAAAFAVLLVLAVSLLPMTAFAATKEYTVTVEEGAQSYLFELYWENTALTPEVAITDPSGTVHTLATMPDVVPGEGEMMFYFADPLPGEWKVAITGEGIGKFQLTAGVVPGRMDITAFTVAVAADGAATATWAVADSEENLHFEIWATPHPENRGGSRMTAFDGAAAGGSHSFAVGDLDSGTYYFYLKAVGTGGIFATAYADSAPLQWHNPGALPALQQVAARMLDHELWLSWQPSQEADSYRVVVTDSANGEVLFDETFSDNNHWYGAIPETTAQVNAWVAACNWRGTGEYTVFTVDREIADGATVGLPEADRLNTRTVVVPVSFAAGCTASVSLNGEMILSGQTETGDYRVDLAEGDNLLAFYITDPSGNIRSFGKQLHVDTLPPVLSIAKDLDGLTTDRRSVWLSGLTENGAVLTVNGQPIETQRGYFNYEYALNPGKNTLQLVSTDGVGNISVYTAQVTRPLVNGMLLGWIGCGLVFAALCGVYVARFIRGRKAGGHEEKPQA